MLLSRALLTKIELQTGIIIISVGSSLHHGKIPKRILKLWTDSTMSSNSVLLSFKNIYDIASSQSLMSKSNNLLYSEKTYKHML